jgi:hypothetical protein
MSDTNLRTEAQLQESVANLQLQFCALQYIMADIICQLTLTDYECLNVNSELHIPIVGPEIIVALDILADTEDGLASLSNSLNALGEQLKLSFDIDQVADSNYELTIYTFSMIMCQGYETFLGEMPVLTTLEIDAITDSEWQKDTSSLN